MKSQTRKSKKMITATINLNAIQHNLFFLRKKSNAEVMVVLKANAYGLGMIEIAKFIRTLNVIYLGDATIDEAIQLRESGDKGKIVAWLYDDNQLIDAVKHDIEIAIFDERQIPIITKLVNKIANVHLFVDTGINRNGVNYKNALEIAEQISKTPKLKLVGVMSHLCCSFMKNKKYTNIQYEKFEKLCNNLSEHNIHPEWVHISNSGGILNYNTKYNMVRSGTAIFGLVNNKNLLPVLSLSSKIIQIKKIEKGEGIGYDRKYIVTKPMMVAIVPIGYADIIPYISRNLFVHVNGARRKVLGLVSMDQIVIESTIYDKIGNEVELFGKHQSIYDFIKDDTINVINMISHLGNRVHKQYIHVE